MTSPTALELRWRSIADIVRDVMAREGISLAEFDRRSGVSVATLRPLLANGRPIRRADKIAQLGIAIGMGADGIKAYLRGIDVEAAADRSAREVRIDAVDLEAALAEVTSALEHLQSVVAAGWRGPPLAGGFPLQAERADP